MISRELLWEMWAHDAFGAGGFRETIKKTLLACGFNDDAVCTQLKDIIDCGVCFAHYFEFENSNGKEENRISSFLSPLEIMFAFKSASSEENLKEKNKAGLFESAFFSLTEAEHLLLWKHHIVFAKLDKRVGAVLADLNKTEIEVIKKIFADFRTELETIQATLNAYEAFSREVPRKKLPADANVKRYLAAKDSLRDSIIEGILKQSGSKEGLNNENDRSDR